MNFPLSACPPYLQYAPAVGVGGGGGGGVVEASSRRGSLVATGWLEATKLFRAVRGQVDPLLVPFLYTEEDVLRVVLRRPVLELRVVDVQILELLVGVAHLLGVLQVPLAQAVQLLPVQNPAEHVVARTAENDGQVVAKLRRQAEFLRVQHLIRHRFLVVVRRTRHRVPLDQNQSVERSLHVPGSRRRVVRLRGFAPPSRDVVVPGELAAVEAKLSERTVRQRVPFRMQETPVVAHRDRRRRRRVPLLRSQQTLQQLIRPFEALAHLPVLEVHVLLRRRRCCRYRHARHARTGQRGRHNWKQRAVVLLVALLAVADDAVVAVGSSLQPSHGRMIVLQDVLQFLATDDDVVVAARCCPTVVLFRFPALDRDLLDPVVTGSGRMQGERCQHALAGDADVATDNVRQLEELHAQTLRGLANLLRVGFRLLALELVHVGGQRPDVQFDHQGLYAVAKLQSREEQTRE